MASSLSIDDIKSLELNILLHFVQFCKNNNLKYYLCGGTLLGAIRHKGFIPWDDDIDVCMPREDYEKFLTLFFHERYLVASNKLKNSKLPFAKIIDTKTVISKKYRNSNVYDGVCIDVLPVDGLPKSLFRVGFIYLRCSIYRRLLFLSEAKLGEGKTIFKKYIKYIFKPFLNIFPENFWVNLIEEIAKKNSFKDSKYVGIVTWGLYGIGERMLKVDFDAGVEVEFEGNKFITFSCWHSYLKGIYGDYMNLPPKEKQVSHHDFEAYWKE